MYQDQLWWLGSNVWVFCQLVAWIMALKWDLAAAEFSTACRAQKPACSISHHALKSPSRLSKIIHWMYQDQLWWLGSNGLGLLSILVAWIMTQKWDLASWMFHRPVEHTNQPAPSHHALGSSSRPSKIIHWMIFGGLNSCSKFRICPAEFSSNPSTQTRLLQDLQLMDPNLNHPKSSIGCIKINCDGWEVRSCQLNVPPPTVHKPACSISHHALGSPSIDPPKSSIGCIKMNCDGWEAMVWVFCQLVAWIMTLKWDLASWMFHRPVEHTNQPAPSHHALGSSSRPSKIIHLMIFGGLNSC
jgi:hypothetical protein